MLFVRKEIIHAICSWRFATILVVSLALLFVGLSTRYSLDPIPPEGWHPFHFNAYDAWRVSVDAYVLFAPLAATMLCADGYVREREQGFARLALMRMSHTKYIFLKLLTNLLAGGLAVALPLTLGFVYTLLIYKHGFPPPSYIYTGNWTNIVGFLSGIYVTQPFLYVMIRIFLSFVFGATIATLGMAISPFTRNRYVVIVFPLVFFWLGGFVFNFIGLPAWWSAYALWPDGISTSNWMTIFFPLATIFTVSVTIIFMTIKKYDSHRLY